MTKKHFQVAANLVHDILQGYWTNECPAWAEQDSEYGLYDTGEWDNDTERNARYTRAVQTAEAFIILFRVFNPLFDETRFLSACGLVAGKKGK